MSTIRIDPLMLKNARRKRKRRRNPSGNYGTGIARYMNHASGSAIGFVVPTLAAMAAAKMLPAAPGSGMSGPALAQIAIQLAVGPVGGAVLMNGPKLRKYQAAYMGATFYPGIQAIAILMGVDELQALLPFPRDQLMAQLGELGDAKSPAAAADHILDPWRLRK